MEPLEILLNKNQNLIYKIAHSYHNYPNKEDLYQAGRLGFIEAYNHYDESREVKFTTFAYPYILGSISCFIRNDKPIKTNYKLKILASKIEKIYNLLSQKLMREPTTKELASFLNVDEKDIIDALNANSVVYSTDEIINDDGKDMTLLDFISNDDTNIDDLLALKFSLEGLSPEEKLIIENRYFNDYTQTETAEMLGISQVQVSRKEKKVLQKLKKELV
jgi:RNA polymerase sporulation-specific sigma factor